MLKGQVKKINIFNYGFALYSLKISFQYFFSTSIKLYNNHLIHSFFNFKKLTFYKKRSK